MILLCYMIKNPLAEGIPTICEDIELSIEVFTAMGHHRVATRCLELVIEVFDLAKKTLKEQQADPSLSRDISAEDGSDFFANLIDPFILEGYAFNDEKINGLSPDPWAQSANVAGEGSNALEMFLNFTASRYDDGKVM